MISPLKAKIRLIVQEIKASSKWLFLVEMSINDFMGLLRKQIRRGVTRWTCDVTVWSLISNMHGKQKNKEPKKSQYWVVMYYFSLLSRAHARRIESKVANKYFGVKFCDAHSELYHFVLPNWASYFRAMDICVECEARCSDARVGRWLGGLVVGWWSNDPFSSMLTS